MKKLVVLIAVPPVNPGRFENMGLAHSPSPPCPNARHANRVDTVFAAFTSETDAVRSFAGTAATVSHAVNTPELRRVAS